MTRGRKKDLTIPPTRALVQQRDYRARKASYVSDLEGRLRKAEEENAQLRRDLTLARAGVATPSLLYDPSMVEASAELLHNLSVAAASLSQFQEVALSKASFPTHTIRPSSESEATTRPCPEVSLSPEPSQERTMLEHAGHYRRGRKRLYRENSPYDTDFNESSIVNHESRSASMESECCGGVLDRRNLVETKDDDVAAHAAV
ncbi:hypothetical protein K443DRAFT_671844 [Laccaria amethystina LaAM-08-1]|uniref:BZIP domain-containing protein n=1 Tax=Laccaria amethystina LaAM-08-1 TaxID=1095629 RepID=A0A0C9Y5U1_9AGAR|nr:hypothetical protein K443DRAFT_671844 [Laccaria amethystina LaAM-08-1]